MTQEEIAVLHRDITSRLSYPLYVTVRDLDDVECEPFEVLGYQGGLVLVRNTMLMQKAQFEPIHVVKPILRPMSSMTSAERAQLECALELDMRDATEINISHVLEFYLEHHLDHNGLIPRGLAVEAYEGLYK